MDAVAEATDSLSFASLASRVLKSFWISVSWLEFRDLISASRDAVDLVRAAFSDSRFLFVLFRPSISACRVSRVPVASDAFDFER